jgi:preprotein translocase subunit SecA
LRRSVSLRAYGQRDPLIEYRREGLIRFRQLERDIEAAVCAALPRLTSTNDAQIRREEASVRAALESAGKEESPAQAVRSNVPGRNDLVTIVRGAERQTLKYKKAEPLLTEGWSLVP